VRNINHGIYAKSKKAWPGQELAPAIAAIQQSSGRMGSLSLAIKVQVARVRLLYHS